MKYVIFSIFLHVLVGLIGSIVLFKDQAAPPESSLTQKVMLQFSSVSEDLVAKGVRKDNGLLRKAKTADTGGLKQVKDKLKLKNDPSMEQNADPAITLDYTQELKQYLERSKHYPRQAIRLKQSGVVEIKVKIDSEGVFSNIKLSKASTFPVLDQAAISLLKKLGRFKPLPKNIPSNSNFTIPIAYVMGEVN